MTGKNINWKNLSKQSETTGSRSGNVSGHSYKKLDLNSSNTLREHYVALPGDTPTKITLKRYSNASASNSSSKYQIKSSSAKRDVKQKEIAEPSLTTPASTSVSAIVRKPKEPSSNSSGQQANLAGMTSTDEKITVAKNVERHDLPSKNSTNDKKRAADSEETPIAKKPRLTTDAQTVQSKPLKTVMCITNNSQVPATKRSSLATSIISFSHKSANALHQMQQYNNKFKQHTLPPAPLTSLTRSIVTATPPMPPHWTNNYEETILALDVTFQKYEIEWSTDEYQTIESMLYPLKVNRIRQIVNPDLWKRFVANRKEMLRSKSDDLNILSELGLDERDVMRCTFLVLNHGKGRLQSPYSDNMALLFHCTKSKTNLNNILSQGLDERLSNVFGGRLGKGIYFADDPQKAIQYDGIDRILIFAVLLGDCISVDHFPFKNALVREPEKHPKEMRNLKDHFFDSIVGRPAGYNEYVIYNRHQCCPLYEVNFVRSESEIKSVNTDYAVKCLPPFAWLPDIPIYAGQKVCKGWPFMADELFKKMEALPLQQDECIYSEVATQTNETSAEQQVSTDKKLATLTTFGFRDAARNKDILSKYNNDIYLTLNYLLDDNVQHFTSTPPCPSLELFLPVAAKDDAAISNPNASTQLPSEVADFLLEFDSSKTESINVTQAEMVDCTICYNEYESFTTAPELWKQLKCGHKMCAECHSRVLTTRTTMSAVEQTFLKCPYCHDITGIQIGTCPDIQMKVTIIPNSCDGYEQTTTISINYFVDAAYQLNRTAYLPNNDEGQEVLKLLMIAYDRRLCFSIGESVTTGRKNVLVWGIHHKTSRCGGISQYGYPDSGYLNRVKLELKLYGIE